MRRLRQAALILVFGLLFAGLLQAAPASASINPQISFQGKLTNPDGTNVTDGTYSIRFRIYDHATNDAANTCSANSCKWEETQGSVSVSSGLFHVMLGSSTTLPGSVDFNASALYLGVKVGSDSEMTPRIRLGAAAQAFNSDLLDGLDSAAFGQLAQGQTWTGANVLQPTTNITGLTVKQTSTGSPTADIFNVQTANATSIIQVTGPAANEAAVTISSVGGTRNLTLNSGSGTIVLGASTLSRTASGTTSIDLVDSGSTVLNVKNTGAGTASIDVDGGYKVAGSAGASTTCSGGQFLQNQVVNGGIVTGGTCAAAGGASSNSFTILDTPSGTDPTADTATDTVQLLVTGSNLTITGADNPETITFDISESALAGNGLAANGDALDITTGNGLQLNSDAVRVNQDFAFTWTADHTWNLQGTENLDVTSDLAGTVNMLGLVGTPSASAGTTRGLFIQQANSANTNGLDSGIVVDNADADLALATAIEITNSGNFATGITKGIDFNATGIVTDIELQNAEQIDNNTDDNVTFTGTGGTNNETFTIDLDSNASSGATLSSGGAFVLINDNLSVGIDGNTTENISYAGFTFSGNDLYVDDQLGVNGNAFFDGTLSVLGATTHDGLVTFNTDVDFTLAGTENIAVTHDLAGTVNVLSIIGTPSTTAGTAQGIFVQQANSANSNGFDAGAVIDNADTDLAMADGILVLSSGFNNGVTDAIDVSAANIQNGINLGSNNILLNGDTVNDFTGNGITVSANALTIQAAASADGLSSNTSSGSGLEVLASGVAMLQGCSDTQILKWNEASDVWACAADAIGDALDFDSIYAQSITNTNLNMEIDNAGGLTFDLTTTGDFAIRDNTTAFATYSNTGAITFAPTAGQNFTINQAAGTNTQVVATAAPTTDQLVVSNSGQASATTGVDGIQVTFGTSNASGDAIHVTPSYAGGATDALTYNGLEIDGFSPTNSAGTDTVNGIKIGNLTDPGATVTSVGLTIGTGWDTGLVVNSGSIVTSNLGIDLTDSDTNPSCAAGDYRIYADTSETKIKKCQNGVVSDINAVPDINSFRDTTADTIVDADTTNYWDGTVPNITPQSTSSEIMVTMTAVITGGSATDSMQAFRILRSTGTLTCQTSGTDVSGLLGTANQAASPAPSTTVSTVFVDAPATTSNVKYTLCSEADTETATGTVARIDFTLFEINDAADLAEVYPTNDNSLAQGEVVSMDPALEAGVLRSSKAYDNRMLGVVSTNPALVIGGRNGEGTNGKPIALSGRVPVKVMGPIHKGDVLTSSNTPGVAMKATKAGPILGIAMGDYDASGVGSVLVFVKPGYFNGANIADILGDPTIKEGTNPNISATILKHYMEDGIPMNTDELSEVVTDRVVAGLEVVTPRITTDTIALNTITPATNETITINSGLTIGGDTVFQGKTTFQKLVLFMERSVFKNDVEFDGTPTFNNNSGGFATIKKGEDSVQVTFSKPFATPPIVTVSIKNGQFVDYAYKDLTEKGFTIVLKDKATADIEFAWNALSVKDAKLSGTQQPAVIVPEF